MANKNKTEEKGPKKNYDLKSDPASSVGQVTPEMVERQKVILGQASGQMNEAELLEQFGGMEERNNELVKPESIKIGDTVMGILLDVQPSPSAKVDAPVLLLMNPANRVKFMLPVTGSIRQALCPGLKRIGKEKHIATDLIIERLRPETGKLMKFTRQDDKESGEFKKKMYIFKVTTSVRAVDVQALLAGPAQKQLASPAAEA